MPASTPGLVRSLKLDSFRPETLAGSVTRGSLDHVQLRPGRFVANLVHADLGGRLLDYGVYNLPLLCWGGMPADHITLGFVASDAGVAAVQGVEVHGAAAVLLPEYSELYYRMAPLTRWMGFQVDRGMLEQIGFDLGASRTVIESLDAPRRLRMQRVVSDAVEILAALERHDADVLDEAAASSTVAESLVAAFAEVLPSRDADAMPGQNQWRKRHWRVKRTFDFFEANFSDPIQVMQLCTYVGVGIRSLERILVESCGANPKQLLMLMRLAKARRALLVADPEPGDASVSKIATECGFFHLGRFSRYYRTLYGELPSATLRSADGVIFTDRQSRGRR